MTSDSWTVWITRHVQSVLLCVQEADVAAEMDALRSQSADKYEFDAPAHIIDMEALQNEDGADAWFGKELSMREEDVFHIIIIIQYRFIYVF